MIDANLIFDGTINATTGAATGVAIVDDAASTNVLDMLAARDVGEGYSLEVHVVVTETFLTCTSLNIDYQTSADNSTFVDVLRSPTYAVAALVAGAKVMRYKVPQFQLNDTGTPNRYHRLNYTVNGSNATAGKVFAFLTGGDDQDGPGVNYPANYTVA